MATSNVCSTCKKPSGIKYCVGCKNYFCTKDFKVHEQDLLQELDKLVDRRDHIQQRFASLSLPINHSIFEEINQWEINIKQQVTRAAQAAREKVNAILSRKRSGSSESLAVITEQLRTMKETEDFVETHLEEIKKKLNDSEQMLEQLTQSKSLVLEKNKSDHIQWDQLLAIVDNNSKILKSKALECIVSRPYTEKINPEKCFMSLMFPVINPVTNRNTLFRGFSLFGNFFQCTALSNYAKSFRLPIISNR